MRMLALLAVGAGILPNLLSAQQGKPAPTAAPNTQKSQQPPAAVATPTPSPGDSGASMTSDAAPLRLLRCFATSDVGCFRVLGDLNARGFAGGAALTAYLDSSELIGPGAMRTTFDPNAKLRLLIVYDVSGSMKPDPMAFTRAAVGKLLEGLPPSVTVAVVPFGSRGVQAAFTAARFAEKQGALQQLRAIPAPRADANTALYSAIVDGLQKLDLEARGPGGGTNTRSIMLVITDGRNDVGHPGDDAGLLSQAEGGRDKARAAIDGSPHQVWLVGAGGGVDSLELNELAGARGRARTVEMEPGLLSSLLQRILDEMQPRRMLVYGIPVTTRAGLGRRSRWFRLAGITDSLRSWRPPLVALPPFEGVADSALLAPRVRMMTDQSGTDMNQRLTIGIPLFLLVLLAYVALPRVLGAAPKPEVAEPATTGQKRSEKPVATSALRSVVEAPPRKPTDITRDAAI